MRDRENMEKIERKRKRRNNESLLLLFLQNQQSFGRSAHVSMDPTQICTKFWPRISK